MPYDLDNNFLPIDLPKKEAEPAYVTCTECKSQYFEEVECSKFLADHHLIIGQHVPTLPGTVSFKLLRCVKCGHLVEPRVINTTRDIAGGDNYSQFLDTLEKPVHSRKIPGHVL